ncbi:MAG TPA: oligosaccharide flippase family protein [Candidatus Limnocylindria bacterium]|nr:oligosaccharide flippase family protein [Candidatus Limnocylindria bacterium]
MTAPRGGVTARPDIVRGALRDGAWNVAALGLPGVANIIIVAILIRTLGPEGFAPWAAAIGLLGVLTILDGGLSTTIARDVARARAGDLAALDLVRAAMGAYAIIGALVLGGGIGLSLALPSLLGVSGAGATSVVTLAAILAGDFAVVVATGGWLGALRGARRFDLVFAANATQVAVAVPMTLVLVPGLGLVGAASAQVAGRLLGRAVAAIALRRVLPSVPIVVVGLSGRAFRRVGAFTIPVLAITVSTHLGVGIDPVIVAASSGAVAVGLYAAGAGLVRYLAFLLFPVLGVLLPAFSGLAVESAHAAPATLIRCVRLGALVGGLAFGTLAVGASDALTVWIGRSDQLSVEVLVLYAVAHALWTPSQVMILMLIARGQHGLVGTLLLSNAVLNALVSIALAYVIGPVGVAVGTLVFLAIVHVAVIPALVVRRIGISAAQLVTALATGFGPAGAIVIAAGLIPVDGMLGLLVRGGVALGAAAVGLAVDQLAAGRSASGIDLRPDEARS